LDTTQGVPKHIGEVIGKRGLVPSGSKALLLELFQGWVGGQDWGAIKGTCWALCVLGQVHAVACLQSFLVHLYVFLTTLMSCESINQSINQSTGYQSLNQSIN
jgi:hypothetical protein